LSNINIEKFHMIYKNLIQLGKDLDADSFRASLVSQGFVQEERVVPTPTGPLKEYVLREPRNLRDLIVISTKGFVVDAWDLERGLDLLMLAYDEYERILGDLIRHTLVNIIGDYRITVFIGKDPEEIISNFIDKSALNKFRKAMNRDDARVFSVGLSLGIPKPPHEWIIINLTPLMAPTELNKKGRIQISIRYQGVDSEKGILFLRNINKLVEKIVKGIL